MAKKNKKGSKRQCSKTRPKSDNQISANGADDETLAAPKKKEVGLIQVAERSSQRINTRFIVTFAVILVVFAVGMHFLHAVQVDRNSHVLLDRAAVAEADDRLQDAILLLSQYVRLNPEDTDALARIGTLVNRADNSVSSWRRVYLTCEEVLRRDQGREDAAEIRWQLVQVAMKLRRFRDASDHLAILRDSDLPIDSSVPDEAELCFIQGQCQQHLGRHLAAAQYYLASIQLASDRLDSYSALASLILQRFAKLPTASEIQDDRQLGRLDNMSGFKFAPELLAVFPADNKTATFAHGVRTRGQCC